MKAHPSKGKKKVVKIDLETEAVALFLASRLCFFSSARDSASLAGLFCGLEH